MDDRQTDSLGNYLYPMKTFYSIYWTAPMRLTWSPWLPKSGGTLIRLSQELSSSTLCRSLGSLCDFCSSISSPQKHPQHSVNNLFKISTQHLEVSWHKALGTFSIMDWIVWPKIHSLRPWPPIWWYFVVGAFGMGIKVKWSHKDGRLIQ